MNKAKIELDNACSDAIQGNYEKLVHHEGHKLEVAIYGLRLDENAAIECMECGEVLVDFTYYNDDNSGFLAIAEHHGHDIDIIVYTDRVTIECLTCNKVIVMAKPE